MFVFYDTSVCNPIYPTYHTTLPNKMSVNTIHDIVSVDNLPQRVLQGCIQQWKVDFWSQQFCGQYVQVVPCANIEHFSAKKIH